MPGISALAFFGSGPTLIVLSNYNEPLAADLGRKIVESLLRLRAAWNSE